MEMLRELCAKAAAAELEFVVIGGHAVNSYGVGRQTADLDLLVRDTDADKWKTLLRGLSYTIRSEQAAFIQFEPPASHQWPVDLVLVDERTFTGVFEAGKTAQFSEGAHARVPSVEHLIALKLHALKQVGILRELVDVPDIVALVEVTKIDYTSVEFKTLSLRYGDEAIYEQIVEHCRRRGL
ncbi:MAG: hypothetical protein KJ052_10795 [Candidatus Hydrogenedentes bacterium]|nr:hypothetical protein [Candidatus Hydrogenedentota bacterium]